MLHVNSYLCLDYCYLCTNCDRFAMSFLRARGILYFISLSSVYEYFNEQDGYEFLPFRHVEVYKDEVVPDSLIWVCRYCNFWCEVFDPLIM
jgi:hypothetical protein